MKKAFFGKSSIAAKAKIIILVFSVITIFLSLVSFTFLEIVKYDFDRLFEKRTASVAKLHALKDYFAINIADTVTGIESKKLSNENGLSVLSQGEYLIGTRWNEYKSIVKPGYEGGNVLYKLFNRYFGLPVKVEFHIDDSEYLDSMDAEIVNILNLADNYVAGRKEAGPEVVARSTNISSRLSQLIDLHLQSAFVEKQRTDAMYTIGFRIILLTFVIGIVATAISSRIVLNSVAQQSQILEKIIEEKTLELLRINEKLEERVAMQVAENRKKDSLLQSQAKLAAMGEVIANIAHQWRQPLNAMTAIIQSFKLRKISGSLSDEFINEQVSAGIQLAAKMSNTIQDFRNFFRPENKQNEFLISKSIKSALSFFDAYAKNENIGISVNCKADSMIMGYEGSLTQVLLNILNNANDSIAASGKESGLIIVKTKKRLIDNKSYIIIQLLDNGGGFDSLVLDRVFEPYFTTKHQSVGTGLGLYMTKKIIEDHMDGIVEVKNLHIGQEVFACVSVFFKCLE